MREFNYIINNNFNGKQVQQFLKHLGFSRSIITSLKHDDRLLCNGNHIRTIDLLKTGDKITVKLEDDTDIIPNNSLGIPIAYEDDDIVVFDKPPFMPVHPSLKHYDDTLANYFTALYPETVFRSINRLDRNTSGLVLVAKNKLAAARLSGDSAFHPNKVYYAVVEGNVAKKYGKSGEIIAPIARISDSIINREVREDGQFAHTRFKVLKSTQYMSLLEIKLITGRTHQIRVHFSWAGYPLIGDDLYGGNTDLLDRQALHCGLIDFIHPVNGRKICVKATFPKDMEQLINNMSLANCE